MVRTKDYCFYFVNLFFLVYKIGTKTNSINDTCPKYAERNSTSGICECLPGYKATVDNHQCG